MNILVLGGTHFVGRSFVEAALRDGHHVTALNRGRSGRDVAGASVVRADRTDHHALAAALGSTAWDAVVDTWSGAPVHATFAAALLGQRTNHYAFVSSRSVYSWPIALGSDESHPTVTGDPADETSDDYARAKRGSEIGVLAARPDALIARAGTILGPYEDIGRLPWWLLRLRRGGQVIAPGPQERPLQYVDARDLAEWMTRCAQEHRGGVFNAVSEVGHTTMGELLDEAIRVTGGDAELVWFTPEEIEMAGLAPWTELPIWLPPTGPLAALHDCDVSAALGAGLRCRPTLDTVRDTWDWLQTEGPPEQRSDRPVHGIDPDREVAAIRAHLERTG